jgi:hypothetical protein
MNAQTPLRIPLEFAWHAICSLGPMATLRLYVTCIAVLALSSSVAADPIRKVGGVLTVNGVTLTADDFLVVNKSHVLSPDDLRVLAELPDNGWHLGWFKRSLEQADTVESPLGSPPSSSKASHASATPIIVADLPPSSRDTSDPGATIIVPVSLAAPKMASDARKKASDIRGPIAVSDSRPSSNNALNGGTPNGVVHDTGSGGRGAVAAPADIAGLPADRPAIDAGVGVPAVQPAAVPEPATLLLIGSGVAVALSRKVRRIRHYGG